MHSIIMNPQIKCTKCSGDAMQQIYCASFPAMVSVYVYVPTLDGPGPQVFHEHSDERSRGKHQQVLWARNWRFCKNFFSHKRFKHLACYILFSVWIWFGKKSSKHLRTFPNQIQIGLEKCWNFINWKFQTSFSFWRKKHLKFMIIWKCRDSLASKCFKGDVGGSTSKQLLLQKLPSCS